MDGMVDPEAIAGNGYSANGSLKELIRAMEDPVVPYGGTVAICP